MDSRAESAKETRQRIVTATLTLHRERGVLATSHRDIAQRADVSVGTVYHHFPTLDSIVRACGARVHELFPPPAPDCIDSSAPLPRRIEQLAAALVDMYAAMPFVEKLRADRDRVEALDFGLAMRERAVDQLILRALGNRGRRNLVRTLLAAVLDAPVIHRLLSSGMSRGETARVLAALINAWLKGGRS